MAGAGISGVASSALQAAYAQLQTTGHNIANVNTPGYTRQHVALQTAGGNYTGAGFIGRGVVVADVQRRSDQFLTDEVAISTAMNAADKARASELDRIQTLFADSELGIGAAYDDWQSSLADFVNEPANSSVRQAVLSRADTLVQRIHTLDSQLSSIHSTQNERLIESARNVSSQLDQLARLNQQIGRLAGSSSRPNDLYDQRDYLVQKINESMRVTSYVNMDGTATVLTTAGNVLIAGPEVAKVAVRGDPENPNRLQVVVRTQGNTIAMDAVTLGGGQLAGLLRARDEDLAAVRNSLGQLAAGLATAYNEQQSLGVDQNGNPGAALFSLGTPKYFGADTNSGTATLSLAIADGQQLQASDYSLLFDGTQYRLTRLSDGQQQTFASTPATVDGFSVAISGTPAAGDQFSLSVASEVVQGFRRVLNSGSGLAGAAGVTAQAGGTNAGDGRVQSFVINSNNANQNAPVSISFTSSTTFDVTGTGTGNPTGLTYAPGQTLSYNGWSLQLSGAPRAGDQFSVSPTTSTATDNRNVRAMLDLGNRGIVAGRTVNGAYASLVAEVGIRAQSADLTRTQSRALLENANAARAEAMGVNLDEEAAALLQYQQAYQAAAKLLATTQSLFESLLAATGR